MTRHNDNDDLEDADLVLPRLFRALGPRAPMPSEMRQRWEKLFHSELVRHLAAKRLLRKRIWASCVGTGILIAAIAYAVRERPPEPMFVVADRFHVTAVSGGVNSEGAGENHRVSIGEELNAGRTIRTDARGLLALRYQDADVRLNSDSVAILQSSHVQLIRGGIYIDEGRSPHRGPAVIVGTQFGTLTHVGTQFLVSVTDDDMRLAVREGAVAYSSNAETLTISAQDGATELIVSHTGLVTRRVPATGDLWSWTVEAAPGFVVNARSADAFLTWATRQTGAQLRYADDAARFHSETIVIHGDVRPLSVTRGFEILKATTGLNVDTSDPLIVFVSVPRAPSPGGRQSVD